MSSLKETSIVRQNLMDNKYYTGYCGNWNCKEMPRTKWNKELQQFKCNCCGWVSQYPKDFLIRWKTKHNID